jgi:AraC-like DNA-binding protein
VRSGSRSVAESLAAASFADIVRMERKMPDDWLGAVTGVGAVQQFEDLRIPCSLVTADRKDWLKIWGTEDNVAAHELLQGAEAARSAYNDRCLARVQRTGRPLVATHQGFSDAFVPIGSRGKIQGFLVSGSFATSPWSAADIRTQWQKLTGRPARFADPALLSYAQAVLSTPVLPRRAARAFLAMVCQFAWILDNAGDVRRGRARWHRLTQHHLHRRLHFNMWQMAAGLVDPVRQGVWSAAHRSWARRYLGLTRLPTLVLALRPGAGRGRDALERLVEDQRFAVACADIALEIEDAACGRAGRSAAYLLLHCDPASPERPGRRAAVRLVEIVCSRLRKKGHEKVHVGVSARTPAPSELARCLREALLALEWAVHKNEPVVFHEDKAKEAAIGPARFLPLYDLLRSIREGALEEAALAVEGLVSEIVWQSGANGTSARAYVDAFYAQALHALGDLDLVEPSVIADHLSAFQRALEQAPTVAAMTAVFREHVQYLIEARRHPRSARRDSKLARVLRYLEAHAAERVDLARAAKMAGYAPQHFSRLLRKVRGQTFEQLVLSLRIARAKELLASSDLAIVDVAASSGLRSLSYFHRLFRRQVGMTPATFRGRERRH